MCRNNKAILFFLTFLIPIISWGQKFELTSEGLRSSVNLEDNAIEYMTREMSLSDLYAHCKHKLVYEVDFFSYTTNTIPGTNNITVEGYINGSSLLVFGKTEISFKILLEFKETGVLVTPELTKTNGKPLNYGVLFNKKGKVRLAAPKNKIETEINTLIYKILGDIVEIH